MKVDSTANLNTYRTSQQAAVNKEGGATAAGKTDVADFSRGSGATVDKTLLRTKASIQNAVSAPCDPQRLEALKQSVRDGSYHIPTEAIVDSMLED